MDFDGKGTVSEVRVHARVDLDILDAGRLPNAAGFSTKFSSSRSLDHHGKNKKEIVKKKFRKRKKPKCPRRSARKIDDYIFDFAHARMPVRMLQT